MPRRARRLVVAPSYTAPSAMLPASTASAYPDIHEDAATLAHSSVAAAQWLLLVQRPLDGHRQSLASWRTVLDVAHRALIDWPLFGVCATEEQERARSGLTRVGLASELLWRSGVHAMAVAGVGHDARRREAARTQAVSLSQPLSHYYQFLLNKSLRGRARSTLNEHMVLAYAMAGVAMGRGAEAYHRLKDAIGTTRCGQCAVHVGYAGVIAFGMWVEQERLRADRGDGGFGREKRRRVVTSIDSDGDGEEDVDNVDDDDVSSWNTHDPLFREARQYLEESLAMAMDSEMFLVVYCRVC